MRSALVSSSSARIQVTSNLHEHLNELCSLSRHATHTRNLTHALTCYTRRNATKRDLQSSQATIALYHPVPSPSQRRSISAIVALEVCTRCKILVSPVSPLSASLGKLTIRPLDRRHSPKGYVDPARRTRAFGNGMLPLCLRPAAHNDEVSVGQLVLFRRSFGRWTRALRAHLLRRQGGGDGDA